MTEPLFPEEYLLAVKAYIAGFVSFFVALGAGIGALICWWRK